MLRNRKAVNKKIAGTACRKRCAYGEENIFREKFKI